MPRDHDLNQTNDDSTRRLIQKLLFFGKGQTRHRLRAQLQRNRHREPSFSTAFEVLEPRQLLAGVTFLDSFATDTIGTSPMIQVGDIGQSWTDIVGTPNVGTGSTTSGTSAPHDVDIGGASQWVRFDGSGESAQGVFDVLASTNGSTVEFDYYSFIDNSTTLSSNGIFVQGEAGDLLRLQISNNDSAVPFATSAPFEIIVNGLATGISGPAAEAWTHLVITLNESDWDLSWQQFDVLNGETTTLGGTVEMATGLSYLSGAGGGATSVTFTDDGDFDGTGDGLMFISNVETTDANDLPEALNDFVTTDVNQNVSFDVLSNDVDEDALSLVSFVQPSNGTLVDNGSGSFTYTPGVGYSGADQFDYTMTDGSGVNSTATAYVYTTTVAGLPAYATNPNAPAVLYMDFDGENGNEPFNREGDITSFTTWEQDLIRQSVEYIEQAFSMFDVNVTTVLTPDLPKAWMRIISDVSGGVAYVGSFPNNTSRGRVDSGNRNLTTGLAHEFGHILSNTHQRLYDSQGNETAEYRGGVDGEGSIMGVDFAGNVAMWWIGHHSATALQKDIVKIANKIKNNSASLDGFAPDDHESSFALATPAQLSGSTWSAGGVINQTDDIDTFIFDWEGGDVDVEAFRVDPFTQANRGDPSSVDLVLSVFDLDGNLVGFSNPDSYKSLAGLDAQVIIPDLPAGTYAISVGSHGDYADVGTYSVTAKPGTWTGSDPTNINALDSPANLIINWVGSDSAGLVWEDVVGETGFSIERSVNSVDFVEVATTAAGVTSYIDAGGMDPSTRYFYRIRAIDGSGVLIASNIAGATTRPRGVEHLTVSEFIGTSKVLDWKGQRTSGETGFRIERSTDGVNYTTVGSTVENIPSYTDTGLDTSATYYYRVVTMDALGDAAVTTPDNAVARYTFDDRTAADSSLYGIYNDGTLRNGASAVYDVNRRSYVLNLDGVNDHVTVPDSSNINLGSHSNRTISVSFNATSTNGRQMIYEEGGATAGYNIYIDNGLLYVGAWGMNNGVANVFLSSNVNANQWNNVSLVNDTTSGLITGYLNGTAFGSAPSDSMNEHNGDIGIGRVDDATKTHSGNVSSSGSYFAGTIDDLRIYNVVNAVNEAPVATDDARALDDDESVIISVLNNDSDTDGDALKITGHTQGANGVVVDNGNGTLTYTPNFNFQGTDSFTYTINDSQGGTDTGLVSLTVHGTGLVAQYTFDDGTAADVSPKGINNSGTLVNGATVVSDPIRGNVVSFDGVDDHVAVSDSADINLGFHATRTISLSFLADSTSGRQVLYEEGGTTRGYNIYIDNGQLYFGIWGMNGASDVFLSTAISADQWHDVTLVNDASSGLITAYLDGVAIGTAAGASMDVHSGNIGIARKDDATKFHTGNSSGTADFFAGKIDNLRIYNSVNRDPIAFGDVATVDVNDSVIINVLANDTDPDNDLLTIESVTQGTNGSVTHDGTSVTYKPNAHFYGNDTFTYAVSDGMGGFVFANVEVTVEADAIIVGRGIAYAGATASYGSSAIDPTKQALLPGQASTVANYTNYTRGLNLIAVDIQYVAGAELSVDDFEFRVGNTSDPGDWLLLDSSSSIPLPTVSSSDVGSGTRRVSLQWANNAIMNQWVQVTVRANSNTGIIADDVFYFGNQIADVFGATPAGQKVKVNAFDTGQIRLNQSVVANSVGIENVFDIDRSGAVNAFDTGRARLNQMPAGGLLMFTAPTGSSFVASDVPNGQSGPNSPDYAGTDLFFGIVPHSENQQKLQGRPIESVIETKLKLAKDPLSLSGIDRSINGFARDNLNKLEHDETSVSQKRDQLFGQLFASDDGMMKHSIPMSWKK